MFFQRTTCQSEPIHSRPEEFVKTYVKFVARSAVNLNVTIDYVGDDKPSEEDLQRHPSAIRLTN